MNTEAMLERMLEKLVQAGREQRVVSHFAASPPVVRELRAIADQRHMIVRTDPETPTGLRVYGTRVFEHDEWAYGWMLFDKQRKPIE